MRTTHWMVLALLAGTLSTIPTATAGNCNNTNYGVQANTYIIANCSGDTYTYYQYCHQQTGAGVGAGSGAVGVGPESDPSSAAAAEGTAGTNCQQGTGNGTSGRKIQVPIEWSDLTDEIRALAERGAEIADSFIGRPPEDPLPSLAKAVV